MLKNSLSFFIYFTCEICENYLFITVSIFFIKSASGTQIPILVAHHRSILGS